jgi:hypothetical protein
MSAVRVGPDSTPSRDLGPGGRRQMRIPCSAGPHYGMFNLMDPTDDRFVARRRPASRKSTNPTRGLSLPAALIPSLRRACCSSLAPFKTGPAFERFNRTIRFHLGPLRGRANASLAEFLSRVGLKFRIGEVHLQSQRRTRCVVLPTKIWVVFVDRFVGIRSVAALFSTLVRASWGAGHGCWPTIR